MDFVLLSNSFCYDKEYKALAGCRRGPCLSPNIAPPLSDDNIIPVRGLSQGGGATAARVKPP
jgi:hypothetical protein